MDLNPIKHVAVAAAIAAGKSLRAHFGHLENVEKKGRIDLVSEADLAAEAIIIRHIRQHFPDHGILAEESGRHRSEADLVWVIDPLDGTTNFVHQLPQFAVSIAFCEKNEPLAGVVLNPITGALYTALKKQGAEKNGASLQVSTTARLEDSLLVTGFPYCFNDDLSHYIDIFSALLARSRGVRRLGAAALDLCTVAEGVFDGFWEEHLKPWDVAAGGLIALEAGARISDFSGQAFGIYQSQILAANPLVYSKMKAVISQNQQGDEFLCEKRSTP